MMLCVEGRHQSYFGLIVQNKHEGVPERYKRKGIRFTTGKISLFHQHNIHEDMKVK